jgi:7-carboxy-7-deazaguanine synthase
MITGGEPLMQKETIQLLEQLCQMRNKISKVFLETNGSISIENVPKKTRIILDIKCPSSEMHEHNNYENIKFLKPIDMVKFVIADDNDFD